MTYNEAKKLKPGDVFNHRLWTGTRTIEDIEILSKTVKCTDGYTYEHPGIKHWLTKLKLIF